MARYTNDFRTFAREKADKVGTCLSLSELLGWNLRGIVCVWLSFSHFLLSLVPCPTLRVVWSERGREEDDGPDRSALPPPTNHTSSLLHEHMCSSYTQMKALPPPLLHLHTQAVVNMLLRILSLKDQPPYGAPVPEHRHTLPDTLNGVHLLSPSLQTWLIERIR